MNVLSKKIRSADEIVYYFDEDNGVQTDRIDTYDPVLDMYLLKFSGNWFDPSDLFSSKRKCREAH